MNKKINNRYLQKQTGYLPINRWPQDERPREKLVKYGSGHLSNAELLAIMLRTGISHNHHSRSALDLAKVLLARFKNLRGLLNASVYELTRIEGIGQAKASQIIASLELGSRAMSEKNGNNISFRCSEDVANYYIPLMKNLKKEQFRILLLNIRNKIIKEVLISQGSLTSSIVHPREVLKPAIQESASSVIFIHNHPSGDPEPSLDDIEITKRLAKACHILGIEALDHIIIGDGDYFSFKQKNLI